MLIFITSLKHPTTVASKPTMIRLLERTLSTIEAQVNKDFRVIIVCHEIPELSVSYSFVEYVLVDFPPPARDFWDLAYTAEADQDEKKREKRLELIKLDKGKKYLRGLYAARKYNPSHVMFFDADDCLSPAITETVLLGPTDQSWYVGNGYIYSEGSKWIVQRKNDFNTHCWTCYIFSMSVFWDLPENESDVPVEWYRDMLGSHRMVYDWLASKGIMMKKIPYPAVTYIISSGENHSWLTGYGIWISRRGGIVRWIRFLLRMTSFRFLSDKIRQKFKLS